MKKFTDIIDEAKNKKYKFAVIDKKNEIIAMSDKKESLEGERRKESDEIVKLKQKLSEERVGTIIKDQEIS